MKNNNQHGFTLVELMIAIVLGLLITAAAIQLFITGQISINTQKGMAEIQESGNFGLRYITSDIRRTNYENVGLINDRLLNGGILLTSRNAPAVVPTTVFNSSNIPINYPNSLATAVPLSSSKTQLSNLLDDAKAELKSDQLVIQYYADQNGTDCEGNSYTSGRYIVQRYFLRLDTNVSNAEENQALALACEAGWYTDASVKILKNPSTSTLEFGKTDGEILIRRVDYLRFLLGVSNNDLNNSFRYISVSDYLALRTYPRPRISSIQVGMLVRSNDTANVSGLISADKIYGVLDQNVYLKPHANTTKYLRRVVSQTIALRNGMYTEAKAVM